MEKHLARTTKAKKGKKCGQKLRLDIKIKILKYIAILKLNIANMWKTKLNKLVKAFLNYGAALGNVD